VMSRLVLTLFLSALCLYTNAQCLTDFAKLLPEEGVIYNKFAYGSSVSVWGDVLAIGAYDSDTLGSTQAGVVYVYTKGADGNWNAAGILKASAPSANLQLGTTVQVTANYIIVGTGFLSHQGIYIYRKPAGGWTTTTETTIIQQPGAPLFGMTWAFDEDKGLLAINDSGYNQGTGRHYVYHKSPIQEWNNAITPQIIENPDVASGQNGFGTAGVQIYGDRIAVGNFALFPGSHDAIYIFRDQSGTFDNYQLEAQLATATPPPYNFYGAMFQFNETGIIRYDNGKFKVYDTPASGVWSNTTPFCEWSAPAIGGLKQGAGNMIAHGQKIYASVQLSDGTSRLLMYTRTAGSWCAIPSMTTLYTEPSAANGGSMLVHSLSQYNETEIALAWTSAIQDGKNLYASVAVLDIVNSKNQFLVKAEYSAEDSRFGSSIWVWDNILFASSVNEYVAGKKLGAVYIYQKANGQWQKVNKLTAPGSDTDHSFGGFVTGNGEFVAISGLGYNPEKIFVYKKDGADLTHPLLWQTLSIPGSDAEDYDYTKPVMTDDWLVVPVANYTDGSEYLVIYKKDQDGRWSFTQKLKIGTLFVFWKLPQHIAMYGNTIAASNGFDKVFILELNGQTQLWTITQTLNASDPDRDLIFPAFGGVPALYLDGSFFGSSVAMSENQIFVGAPGKNDGATLDVGAIYMYTRPKNGSWTSTSETKKILPASRTAGTFLGSELGIKDNVLSAGATTNSTPGAVFIFQSMDYQWNNIVQLLRLTGDTFAFDGYGATLALNNTDFFIGAIRETNTMGTSAGAVYVTPAPATVKLEPPVCDTTKPYDLSGYPFGGVWSGPGITDTNNGTFDPSLAGTGTHLLTYITPNCNYPGKLQVTVSTGPVAEPGTPTEMTLCDVGVTSVILGLKSESNVTYKWFYREGDGNPWTTITNATTKDITVNNTQTGDYRIEADNGSCIIANEFAVKKETMTLTLQSLPGICDNLERINLNATPTGGTWSVVGVARTLTDDGNPPTLRVNELGNGTYVVQYSYKSDKQCIYTSSTSLAIDRVGEPSLTSAGEFCAGGVTLDVRDLKNATTIQWLKDGLAFDGAGPRITVNETGDYSAIASKNGCSFQTNSVTVKEDPTSFEIPNVVTPNGDDANENFLVKSNNIHDFSIIVINRSGKEVFRSDDVNFKWNASEMPAGVYYYLARYQNCTNEEQTNRGWLSVLK
jgi:gliding motility-associated-like protein